MTREDTEETLRRLGQAADDGFDLLEVALACALHEDPSRDAGPARAIVAEAAARLTEHGTGQRRDEVLAEVLAGELSFNGDLITYDHPAGADLISVAERRKGLPVALGVFYIAAARRCGMPVSGVDFPGHFLLRVETDEGPVAIDPFSHGRLVLPSELTARALQAGLMPGVADRLEELMKPVADRAVAIRLENNIFARAAARGDYPRAERSALRRALIDPNDHRPWLDVAAAREGQGALAGALQALAMAQTLDGDAAIAARAQRERVRMKLN
ncbi:MAG: transglutaminase family protein [Alphaproteobacteria bacterium]